MSRAAVATAAEQLNERFDLPETYDPAVPLTALIESGHNARRKFDPSKLDELAASIREKGIIEPLVVRPFPLNGDTKYEIVAGARRFRASKLAGRTAVPCVMREYSDTDVLELQIIENIQREDLDPIEEALGYKALIDSNPSHYSAGFIADRIGRSEKYVWDTLRLLNLVPAALEHLETGRITRSHAVILSRLAHEQQEVIIDPENGGLFTGDRASLALEGDDDRTPEPFDCKKAVSVKELEHYVADHVRFNVQQQATTAPLEFGETAKRVEAAMAQPGRGKKVIAITHDSFVKPDAKDEKERTFGPTSWKRADGLAGSKTCELSVLGVVAVGSRDYGQAIDVCIARDKCEVHWKQEIKDKARTSKLRESGETKKANKREEDRQREEQRLAEKQAAEKKTWEAAKPAIIDAVVKSMKTSSIAKLADLVVVGCDRSWNHEYAKSAQKKLPRRNADQVVRQAALVVLLQSVERFDAKDVFPKIGKRFGVDVAKILKTMSTDAKEAK